MNTKTTGRQIAYSAVVAALYVALTLPLGSLATSPFIQVRPAEALTILPALFPFSAWGVTIGCVIVNLIASSPLDAAIGGAVTLISALITSKIRNPFLAAIPPVVLNAVFLPLMFILMGYETGYFFVFLQILLSQSIWIYGLGMPLYFLVKKGKEKEIFKL